MFCSTPQTCAYPVDGEGREKERGQGSRAREQEKVKHFSKRRNFASQSWCGISSFLILTAKHMALHRSKLGPVGGGGSGAKSDGGVAVDLDPLSAFALMGPSTEGASTSGGTESGSSVRSAGISSGATRGASRRDKQQSASPPASVQRPRESRGWLNAEPSLPGPPRVRACLRACVS